MTIALSPVTISRLEKAAVDNGFDQELLSEGHWLGYASTQCPLCIWLGSLGDAVFLAAFSQQNVARALGQYGTPMAALLPKGALGGRMVTSRRSTAWSAAPSSSARRFPTSCSTASTSRRLRFRRPPKPSAWSSNAWVRTSFAAACSNTGKAAAPSRVSPSRAMLARQALEAAIRTKLDPYSQGLEDAPFRAQFLCLQGVVGDNEVAREANYLWSALSSATHHCGYELAPTAADLREWLVGVERVVAVLERRPAL